MFHFATSHRLIYPWKCKKRHLLQVPSDMALQILGLSHAKVASTFDAARRQLEHFLDWSKSALVKHRTVISLHMPNKILSLVMFGMVICIAGPLHSVALHLVLVPFVSAGKEMIAKFAIRVDANVGLEIFENMLPRIP